MKRTRLVLVVLAVLALSGCAAPGPESGPTPSPVETADEQQGGTTLLDLKNMYSDAGGGCDNPQRRSTAVAEDTADCEDGAVISVYDSQAQRDSAIAVLQGLQDTNPSPHVIAVGLDWTVNGGSADSVADAMGGEELQIGEPGAAAVESDPAIDLTSDAGLCAADAELSNLELNDALAPVLGYPSDRDLRSSDQDEAIRSYKNAAFERACPARAG